MKTMKKIVAILAVALLLCSMLPLSVMAADGDVYELVTDINELAIGDQVIIAAVNDNFAMSTEQRSNNRGQVAATKNGNSIAYVANLQVFTVEAGSIDGTYAFNTGDGYIYAAGGTGKNNYLRTEAALSGNSSWNIEIAADGIATIKSAGGAARNWLRHNKSSSLFSCYASGQNDIAIYKLPTGVECDHSGLSCGATCSVCGEVIDHEYVNNCDATCEQCGASRDIPGHEYSGALDTSCNNCGEIREVVLPTDPTEIVDAAYGLAQGEAFPSAVQLTGVIASVDTVYSEQYGNVTVTIDVIDANGNLIEGKAIQCYRLKGTGADVIAVGDTITVSGILKNYNGKIEFDTGCTLVSYEQTGCKHEYKYECSTTCELCGKGEREAKCESDAEFLCQEGSCNHCGETVAALDHAFDDQWDADCNYGCGYTRDVEEAPVLSEATIDFSTTTQRTELDVNHQVWVNQTLQFTNNKGEGTTDLIDSSNPVRLYKNTEIIITFPNMTSIEFTCNSDDYATALQGAIGDAATIDGSVVILTFDEPVNSYSVTLTAGQVRMNSITAKANVECAHTYESAVTEPTCNAAGYTTYTCSLCGKSYTEEGAAATGVHTYTNDYDANCNVCNDMRTVVLPADPTEIVNIAFSLAIGDTTNASATLTGVISSVDTVYSEQYSNVTVTINVLDAAGNVIADKPIKCYRLKGTGADDITVGDTITVTGILKNYYGTIEFDANCTLDSYIKHTCVSDSKYECTDGVCTICGNAVAGIGHEYFTPCEQYCMICGELTNPEAAHNIVHVDAKAATCAENGNIEYWFCDVCGAAWLNAECTLNTNLRAVVLPATGEHTYDDEYDADCNVCGDIRDVPEKPVGDIVYGDANSDGVVDLTDASLIQQYLAGYDVTVETSADANGDGVVDLTDASLIQQYLAGYDVQLGPDEPVEPEEAPKYNDGTLTVWPQN